jgi:D-3-phosphoglycerate dehydrogenase
MKIAIGPSSFGSPDPTPLQLLEKTGFNIAMNRTGRRLNESETIELLRDADGLLAGLEPLTRKVMEASPRLKAIARVGIGMDNVDLAAARDRGIRVSNTPEGPTDAVAEMTVAALLALSHQLIPSNEALHDGQWRKIMGRGLRGTRVLIIGFGRIGRRTARLLDSFGADLMVSDPAMPTGPAGQGDRTVTLEEGLARAEVISLHASGTEQILGPAEFQKIRPGTILLNSARGTLVNETALIAALEKGVISQAWLDVFPEEPYHGPLTKFPQVLLTPHVSTYTRQCRLDMETAAVGNLTRDLDVAQGSGCAS